MTLRDLLVLWNEHGTKVLGSLATFVATALLVPDLIPEAHMKYWLFANVLLGGGTVKRGFTNNATARTANAQAGFARPSLLALIAVTVLAGCVLTGCQTPPHKVISIACEPGQNYSTERCIKSIGETWEVYQKRAEDIATDPAAPLELKTKVKKAEGETRPVVVAMLEASANVAEIRAQLAQGQTDEEKLLIANAQLEHWVKLALGSVASFREAF